jgi:hypothetical protein
LSFYVLDWFIVNVCISHSRDTSPFADYERQQTLNTLLCKFADHIHNDFPFWLQIPTPSFNDYTMISTWRKMLLFTPSEHQKSKNLRCPTQLTREDSSGWIAPAIQRSFIILLIRARIEPPPLNALTLILRRVIYCLRSDLKQSSQLTELSRRVQRRWLAGEHLRALSTSLLDQFPGPSEEEVHEWL